MVESALGRSFPSHRKPRIAQIQGPLRFDATSTLEHLGLDLANNGMSIHSYAASCGHACCTSKHELKLSCFPDLKSPFLSKSAQSFRLLQKKVICVSQHTVKCDSRILYYCSNLHHIPKSCLSSEFVGTTCKLNYAHRISMFAMIPSYKNPRG
jgi:hypothetical protein